MKNFVIDYHGGSGGDFLRICLWLLLHPDYRDIMFDEIDDGFSVIIKDNNNENKMLCGIHNSGRVYPSIFSDDILCDPFCDALRYHSSYKINDPNKRNYNSAIGHSVYNASTKDQFIQQYQNFVLNEINLQSSGNWQTRDIDSDCNILIGHDIFFSNCDNSLLELRDTVLKNMLGDSIHRIGLLADNKLSVAICLYWFSKKCDPLLTIDNDNNIKGAMDLMVSHKKYRLMAGSHTLLSVTDLLDKKNLVSILSEKIPNITRTEIFDAFWDKYMEINNLKETLNITNEWVKLFK